MSIRGVKSFQPKDIHIGTIAHGKDILEALEAYCLENNITTAWVNLIGAVSEVTLSYYRQEQHDYVSRTFQGEYEIISGVGNISLKDNVPVGHMHLSLSDTDYRCIGGHLVKGGSKVFACEFALFSVEGSLPLNRGKDDITGLPLWLP